MLELAEIFRRAGPAYREAHGSRMLASHQRAMWDIERCRTAAFGGHLRQCDHCSALQYSYHSCGNRHCPKCQGEQTRRWLETQRSHWLDGDYFLLTFTLPDELRPVARSHQKIVYGALMTAAAQALIKLTADRRYVGAKPGVIAVLHTWTREMLFHPHVHLLVTAGGLSADDQCWVKSKNPSFLVPCRALSVIFRAKVRDTLDKAGLAEQVRRRVWRRKWVVHCQHAGNGEHVLEYLARYVHRIALVNSRLEHFDGSEVTFRYRDNRSRQIKRCKLPAQAFIARFLQHVLPRRFTKVRYYGIYAPSSRPKLERARCLLDAYHARVSPEEEIPSSPAEPEHSEFEARDICPACHIGQLHVIQTIPRTRAPPP